MVGIYPSLIYIKMGYIIYRNFCVNLWVPHRLYMKYDHP